ncbi:exocyst complex component EXO70B1-like [Zingiber officinale]|uniref:Exocyst subunit Exo70 family protein n=1 Tax=Zingiber officinale TaxID=94328 RepID=A0A8J5GJV7_ZINOF|nr:exocyst complex component EXO70B1-like [Zingiber officinale]KAG6508037.1 hypothetical protein ZIOFF_033392 [Zingiber officinale]
MERFHSFPQKHARHRVVGRSLSLGNVDLERCENKGGFELDKEELIGEDRGGGGVKESEEAEEEKDVSAASLSAEIDDFIGRVLREPPEETVPVFPQSAVEKFLDLAEEMVAKHESGEFGILSSPENGELSLFSTIDLVVKLASAAGGLSSAEPECKRAMNRAGGIVHRSMCFLEDELHILLDQDPKYKVDPGSARSKSKRPSSFDRSSDSSDRFVLPSPESNSLDLAPETLAPEMVEELRRVVGAMINAGYTIECCQVIAVTRRNAFDAGLSSLGYEKLSIDDVVRLPLDSLEGEIATWIRVFRQSVEVAFPREQDLCFAVLAGQEAIAKSIFHDLICSATIPLLTFAEAVAMTKRSAEKLFKVLDMYETLRDILPKIHALLRPEPPEENHDGEPSALENLETEMASVNARLAEAAVAIFCELENSIKNDTTKTPVPGGAVHPLTRYVMNYLKYACEYRNTMEHIFKEHRNHGSGAKNGGEDGNYFASHLVELMEMLHANLEGKSRLYKDPSLNSIFLMNNGRYIMQKIKGSGEIHRMLGDSWSRKRSTELRQYHKNYQRETWARVLGCFKDAGLQGKGGTGVAKPALKERFKSFNAMFEEIHKAQCLWVVSDEQLQSELRVSVSAVIVPAYRSFLGRFSQYLDPGRQTEKYIKFGPEELENYIDELFSGNPSSLVGRRK